MINTVFVFHLLILTVEAKSMEVEYFHIFLNLLIVVGLIFITLFFLKRFKSIKYSAKKEMNIVQVMPLGAKEKILLIEVDNMKLVVGVSQGHIQTLYSYHSVKTNEVTKNVNFSKIMQGSML